MEQKKEIYFGKEAEAKLMSGLNKAADAVASTHGARGRTVLIQSNQHTRGITVTKDGVTVMRSINLTDSVENLVVQLLRQAASRTVIEAGDGTTTATVLVRAIVTEVKKRIGKHNNIVDITRIMKETVDDVIKTLKEESVKISYGSKELLDVATVSANNDKELGEIIFNAYTAVGEDGVVTIENSKDNETYFELIEGIKLERSILSPIHINNFKNHTCELEDPYIIVSDMKIKSAKQIEKFIIRAIEDDRPLFIIGDLDQEARQTINMNIQNKTIKAAFIEPPSFGINRTEQLQDIAIAVGAKYVSTHTGDSWDAAHISSMGTAGKVIISRDSTSIQHTANSKNVAATNARIVELKQMLEKEKDENEIKNLNERIANLSGKIAIVFVGANTDAEQKEKRDRVDDSVLAAKAALKDGVSAGGGIALLNVYGPIPKMSKLEAFFIFFVPKGKASDKLVAHQALETAFQAPFKQILENAGKDYIDIMDKLYNINSERAGYDVKAEAIVDMFDMGIIDPTKIIVSALKNAVSTASDILTNSAIIANHE